MRIISSAFALMLLGAPAIAQDAPSKTDAEPGYWTNLFTNTMRYHISWSTGGQDVDVFFNRDKTVSSNVGAKGVWHTEGEPGKEEFCYNLGPFKAKPAEITQCFALRFMNRPRIGAKWGGAFKEKVAYRAEVVAGRATAPK